MKRALFILIILTLLFSGLIIQSVPVLADEALGWQTTEECPFLGYVTDFWHYSVSTSETLYNALHDVPLVSDSKHYRKTTDTYIDLAFQWSGSDDDHSWTVLTRSIFGWDSGAINASNEITGGRIKLKVEGLSTYGGAQYAIAFYPYTGEDFTPPHEFTDWDALTFNLNPDDALTEPKTYVEAAAAKAGGTYLEFELTQTGIDYINKGGNTIMWLRFCFDGAGAVPQPVRYRSGICIYYFYRTGVNLIPILELDYLRGIASREICDHSNAAEGGGGGSIDAVSWLTPRCAWNDEQAGFRIEGDAGEGFTAKMIGADDVILDEITDTIRTNDYFYWYPALEGYTGKFKCAVTSASVNSTWGWSEQFRDAGTMRTFAMQLENEDTSWATDIDTYQVHVADTIMAWYWLSGITEDELSTTTLTIRQGGARENDIFSEYLDDLVTDYMECEDSCNYFMVASRYILAAMGEVEDDLDGLILNLDNPLVGVSKGYYYARIYKTGEGLLIPVSAYWYVDECDLITCPPSCDLAIYIIEGSYAVGASVPVMILNNMDLNFDDRFKNVTLSVVDNSDAPVQGVINIEQYVITIIRPANAITLLLTISTTLDDYVHHSYLTLSAEGAEPPVIPPIPGLPGGWGDAWDWFIDLFSSTWGHWLLMLFLMVIVALIFYRKHRTVTVILCLGIIGFGVVIGWIDVWLVALLGILAGLIIWKLLASSRHPG